MKPRKDASEKRSWLWSRWFMGMVALIFVLISFSLIKEFFRSYKVNNEINDLKGQIAELESSNEQSAKFVEYLKTDLYLEEQARIKLGMKKPGEKTIVLQQDDGEQVKKSTNSLFGSITSTSDARGNFLKWVDYFWGQKA